MTMHKLIRRQLVRQFVLIIMLASCQDVTHNAGMTTQVALEQSMTIPARYSMEVIKIGPHVENFLLAEEHIWILKQWIGRAEPGGLIKMSLQEPYEQRFYELPDSMGGDKMVFDGQSIWVTRDRPSEESLLLKFDIRTGQVIGQYPLDATAGWVSITFGESMVWVVNGGQILKFDASDGSLISRIEPDNAPTEIAFADGKLWVISAFSAKVAVYNALTDKHLVTYSFDSSPLESSISGITFDNEKAWVSHGGHSFTITLIPFALPESFDTLPAWCPPFNICNFGGVRIGEDIHLIRSANGVIYQFDPETGAIIKSYLVPYPEDMIIHESYIWVLNRLDNTISKISP